MKKNSLKLLALGGVAGPILFTVIVLICASLRSGYSHIHQFISELGATGTANANLMNWAGFIPTGVLITMFGVSLIQLLPKKFLTLSGSVLIMIYGIGVFVVGFLSCDPGCPKEGSLENNLHDKISGLIFISVIVGMLILGISFRRLRFWNRFWLYSVISAFISAGFMAGLINSFESTAYTGIWQRLLLLTIFLWLGVIGMQIFRSLEKDEK